MVEPLLVSDDLYGHRLIGLVIKALRKEIKTMALNSPIPLQAISHGKCTHPPHTAEATCGEMQLTFHTDHTHNVSYAIIMLPYVEMDSHTLSSSHTRSLE